MEVVLLNMLHLVDRDYFPVQPNNIIWPYLNCLEKIVYHQLQKSFDNISVIFCDNTNIILYENSKSFQVARASFDLLSNYFTKESFSHITNYHDFLCTHIDQGEIIGFNTEFTLLPNYTWYQDKNHVNSPHYSMIVGYDSINYYLTDAPNLLVKNNILLNNLSPIPKDKLVKVLEKKSSFIIIHNKHFEGTLDIPDLLRKIVTEYNNQLVQADNKCTVWNGRAALRRLYQLLDTEKIHAANLFEGAFISSIIKGRRKFLQNSLELFEGKNNYLLTDSLLNESFNLWDILGNTILKSIMKNGHYSPDKELFQKILITEDLLVKSYIDYLGGL